MEAVDNKISKFLTWATMTPEDYEKRHQMLLELQSSLNFGVVYPFGSYFTGIADPRLSDVDVYFKDNSGRPKTIVLDHVVWAIENDPRMKIINVLPTIRIPIVTFVHVSSQVKCDITFENMMSVQNSKLIRFLLSLDPVCYPLVTIVRNWAKKIQVIHHRNGFKNYSLVLLVIVFLVRKKILPSVYLLQSLVPPCIVSSFWNVNFCDNYELVSNIMKSNNLGSSKIFTRPSDIIPLVLDFFDMMQSISRQVVVCTLTGDFIPREFFQAGNEAELPASQARFLAMKNVVKTLRFTRFPSKRELCLQDPFDMGYNVARSCNDNFFDRLIKAAQETSDNIRSNDPQELCIQLGKYLLNPKPAPKIKKYKKIHISEPPNPVKEYAPTSS